MVRRVYDKVVRRPFVGIRKSLNQAGLAQPPLEIVLLLPRVIADGVADGQRLYWD